MVENDRIPAAAEGIQLNFCKNPICLNYGIPASTEKQPKGPGATGRGRDSYVLSGSKNAHKNNAFLKCSLCSETIPVKSNIAVVEELARFSSYLNNRSICCPNESCLNHFVELSNSVNAYQSFGKTKGGSPRYRCKLCKKTFAVSSPLARQRLPHKNITVFKLLMNKMPLKRICEVAGISMPTLYDKIDFLQRQCLVFAASREIKLHEVVKAKKLYIAIDRQNYIVNWSVRQDKRNIMLYALGSADNTTGYVFGVHLNYDPSLDCVEVENDALKSGDYEKKDGWRKYARLWLYGDYVSRYGNGNDIVECRSLEGNIEASYRNTEKRDDVESTDVVDSTMIRLPEKGMQIHSEYTMYGHFYLLHKLLSTANKIRFFLDQDSGMRAACLSAFVEEIKQSKCDAFYVKINKEMTIDERKISLLKVKKQWSSHKKQYPDLSDTDLKLLLIKESMARARKIGKWHDKWVYHPFPNMSEPEKAICYLTDVGKYDVDHLAWLHNKASLHSIDRFFMQVRRRISLLERPIATASNMRRTWHGYNAYNPAIIIKLLDIFRVFYNYIEAGEDSKTPGMRLGLAKGKIDIEDIIYYQTRYKRTVINLEEINDQSKADRATS